jgi:hypothetical protein
MYCVQDTLLAYLQPPWYTVFTVSYLLICSLLVLPPASAASCNESLTVAAFQQNDARWPIARIRVVVKQQVLKQNTSLQQSEFNIIYIIFTWYLITSFTVMYHHQHVFTPLFFYYSMTLETLLTDFNVLSSPCFSFSFVELQIKYLVTFKSFSIKCVVTFRFYLHNKNYILAAIVH